MTVVVELLLGAGALIGVTYLCKYCTVHTLIGSNDNYSLLHFATHGVATPVSTVGTVKLPRYFSFTKGASTHAGKKTSICILYNNTPLHLAAKPGMVALL